MAEVEQTGSGAPWSGALVAGTLGLGVALLHIEETSSLPVDHQVAFVTLSWATWAAVGLALGLPWLLRRSFRPGAAAAALFLVIEAAGTRVDPASAVHGLALVSTAAVLYLAGRQVGRWIRPARARATWALAALALAIGCAWQVVGSRPAAQADVAAAPWALAVPAGLALGVLVRRRSMGTLGRVAVFAGSLGLAWIGVFGLSRLHRADLAPRRATGPNVLLVTVDTLRADALGCYGNESAHTPNLDRLAREGVLFADAQSPMPMTDPSHTSILTGLYPGNHGVLTNMPWPVARGVRTLPEVLADDGYRTAAFVSGFTLKRSASKLFERFQLFDDDFAARFPDAWLERGLPDLVRRGLKGIGINLRAMRSGSERPAVRSVPAAIDWLGGDRSPFFLWVHLFDPHLPYEPPVEQATRHGVVNGTLGRFWYRLGAEHRLDVVGSEADRDQLLRMYRAEVSGADLEVGRLLDHLRETGLLDETLVVFTSDHGESLGEHDYWFDHGHYLYDSCLRVPLIVRTPSDIEDVEGGTRVESQARLIDVAPTVLDLIGLDPGRLATDGVSLVPRLRDPSAPAGAEPSYSVTYDLRAGKWRYLLAVRTSRWKYVRAAAGWDDLLLVPEGEQLYDLADDPAETRNLVADGAAVSDVLRRMRELADRHWEAWASPDPDAAGTVNARTKEKLEGLGYF